MRRENFCHDECVSVVVEMGSLVAFCFGGVVVVVVVVDDLGRFDCVGSVNQPSSLARVDIDR